METKTSKRRLFTTVFVLSLFVGAFLLAMLLTPSSSRAQQGGGGSGSNNENADCVVSSTSTNCSEGSVVLSNVVVNPSNACIGSAISASVSQGIIPGQVIIDTSYTNANPNATNPTCNDTFTTNNPSPTIVSNWWTVSVGSFSTNGTGLSASFTPTSCGSGSITFNTAYQDVCDTNQNTTSASGGFTVDAVTSLGSSAGLWVDDGDGDPNTDTYLVQYGCYNTITVTAGDCAGLSPANLPSCWTPRVTGHATQIDNMHFSVDGNTIGKSTVNITCGTSYKTVTIIVYEAVFLIFADQGDCLSDVGHSWWSLQIQPSDVYPFLKSPSGTNFSTFGPQGTAGYWPLTGASGPGTVSYGPQGHDATGSYWWCVSFGKYIGALTYVFDLHAGPGTYTLWSNNCTTQAEQVAGAAGTPLGYSGVSPCGLSSYLNELSFFNGAPYCDCQ
jgi:hypothetical protein